MSDPLDINTEEWIMLLRETPLRTMDEIREEREPLFSAPVLAVGMQPEHPEPEPVKLFTGPKWYRPWLWLQWNLGDRLTVRKKPHVEEQSGGRHRLVRSVPETLIYRPKTSQSRGQAAPPPQRHLSLSR